MRPRPRLAPHSFIGRVHSQHEFFKRILARSCFPACGSILTAARTIFRGQLKTLRCGSALGCTTVELIRLQQRVRPSRKALLCASHQTFLHREPQYHRYTMRGSVGGPTRGQRAGRPFEPRLRSPWVLEQSATIRASFQVGSPTSRRSFRPARLFMFMTQTADRRCEEVCCLAPASRPTQLSADLGAILSW